MDANDSLDEMTAQAAGVNVIAPTWFSPISDQGEISSLASADYVAKAHAKGMEVWGLVSNFEENVSTFETLSHTTSRTRLENLPDPGGAAVRSGWDQRGPGKSE